MRAVIGKFMPRSLLGQVMLTLALGLIAAQFVSAVLLYRAAEQRRADLTATSIAFRLAESRDAEERRGSNGEPNRREGRDRRERRIFQMQDTVDFTVPVGAQPMDAVEARLATILTEQGVEFGQLAVFRRRAGDDPFLTGRPRPWLDRRDPRWRERDVAIVALKRTGADHWQVVRQPMAERQSGVLGPILLQTIVILLFLFGLLYLLLRRITRPLGVLTRRVAEFSRQPGQVEPLEERGPEDTRRLIAAYNTMESRIAGMIDEKDVMLGAIGHDLKTPLAALRIRIESVPDEVQRSKMAAGVEDIARTLDDILSLARVARADSPAERTDLAALLAGLVEEYEDMGEPVTLEEPERCPVPVHVTWLKRGVRNLISNAIRYGGSAEVSLRREDGQAVITVCDNGPGIPDGRIAEMLEPFTRGETSRNRATGGAGLGLTLARAIAEQHGGTLSLSNRPEGGLCAEIGLPLG